MHTIHAKQASKSCRKRRGRGRIHLFATNLATRGTRAIARMNCCQKNRCSIVSESHCKQCAGCKQAKHADKHGGGGKLSSAKTCLDEACKDIFKSQILRATSEDLIILILILIINNVCTATMSNTSTSSIRTLLRLFVCLSVCLSLGGYPGTRIAITYCK